MRLFWLKALVTNERRKIVCGIVLAAVGLLLCLPANRANAAASLYFDVNGVTAGYGVVNGGTYSSPFNTSRIAEIRVFWLADFGT